MVKPKPLTPHALRALAEIHVTGLWLWVRGISAFLDDPQRTVVRGDTVLALLDAGLLEEDPEELTVSVSDAGRAVLERNPEAVGRARAIRETRHVLPDASGATIVRPNSVNTPRT